MAPDYFAIGLRPVRVHPFQRDRRDFAGIAPQVREVSAVIGRRKAPGGDSAVGVPLDGSSQNDTGGDGGFVVVGLGVRDAGVIVGDIPELLHTHVR